MKGARPATRDFVGAKPAQHAYVRIDFLDLGQPFSLCLAARIWAVSRPVLGCGRPGVFGSFRSPWGEDCCRGGVRARAPGGAHFGYFCWRHFLVRTLERSQSACAVAGAGARARPGGGLPTLSEPVAEPSSLGRRHSAPIKIGRLQRSHRRGLDQHAGEARRVPEHLCRWRAQGARAARRGGLPALSELVAEPSGLGVPPQCAQVRCGAAFFRSTFLVGTLGRLSERLLCRGRCRSACAAWRGGCLPVRSRWLSRPASGAATARRPAWSAQPPGGEMRA
eukprot:COSAG04_NODE_4769_length_1903_cov_1.024945_2_plen_279_part_00